MKRYFFYYLFAFFLILVLVFRSLLLNISTNLFDWYDYPFVVWVVNSGAQKLINLDIINLFNTNIYFPYTNTAFFTDLMLPQSIIAIPVNFFLKNPIVIFNFIFIFTFILNYISIYVFWQYLFKNHPLSFVGSLFMIFSPYFFLEIGHFQMQSYWPFFFSLTITLKSIREEKLWLGIVAGIICTIQFLASVYLGIFLAFAITVFFVIQLFFHNQKKQILKGFFLIIFFFFLTSGIFIKGYINTKSQYLITRSPNEFITYSAHLSDYLFTSPIHSFIHSSSILKAWNSFDKHNIGSKAAFPGFTFLFLACLSLINIKLSKKQIDLKSSINNEGLFFIVIMLSGFIFSLGPRINFNGAYSGIPSAYYIFLKIIPFLESIRAPSRWSFLFYFGIIYFALKSIQNILKIRNSTPLIVLILIIFLLEYLPIKINTYNEEYTNLTYKTLQRVCKNNKRVLLEVPITHFDGNGGINNGLNRVTKYELASLIHSCLLKNGYSGYDLPALIDFKDNFYLILSKRDPSILIDFLKQENIDIIKINKESLSENSLQDYNRILPEISKSSYIESIGNNTFMLK